MKELYRTPLALYVHRRMDPYSSGASDQVADKAKQPVPESEEAEEKTRVNAPVGNWQCSKR